MIIENKKTNLQYHVTEDEWQGMKQTKDALKFRIISKASEYATQKDSLPPPEVREFIAQQKRETNRRKPKKQNND